MNIPLKHYLKLLAIMVLWGILAREALGYVYLTSTDFPQNQPPRIRMTDNLGPAYRLRAKFPNNQHCAQGWNNYDETLSNLPGPGTYYVELYWVKYDYINGNIIEIQNPFDGYWVTIRPPNSPPVTHSAWVSPSPGNKNQSITLYGHATDTNNNLFLMHFYVWRPTGSSWENVGTHFTYYPYSGNVVGWVNWTPSESGTHWVHIRAVDAAGAMDSNANVTAEFYVRGPQPTVSSQNATVYAGTGFTPSYSGGAGAGVWQFAVGGQTYWPGTNGIGTGQAGTLRTDNQVVASWTAPNVTTATPYGFWVRKIGDGSYMDSDPSSEYTLVVNPIPTCTISANMSNINAGGEVQITVNATNARYLHVDQVGPNPGHYGAPPNGGPDVDDETPPSGAFYDLGSVQSNPSRTLTLTLNTPNTYTFKAAVSDGIAWFYSSNITVTVVNAGTAPTIIAHPQSQSVTVGATVSFSVSASGSPTPTYQWRKGGLNLPGATNSTYSISNVQTSHAGSYDVIVSNSVGNVTSNPATLTVGSTTQNDSGNQNQLNIHLPLQQ